MANTMHEVVLHINGESRGKTSLRSGQFPGTETPGSSTLVKLNAGDVAEFFLYISSAYSDGNTISSSLAAFSMSRYTGKALRGHCRFPTALPPLLDLLRSDSRQSWT